MSYKIKRLVGVGLVSLILAGCVPANPKYNNDFLIPPIPMEVRNNKDELIHYLTYLHRYYNILEDYYYNDETKVSDNTRVNYYLHGKDRKFSCEVTKDIFRGVVLPPPPRVEDDNSNEIINTLINQINLLRNRIRKNNSHMEQLKKEYKHCF